MSELWLKYESGRIGARHQTFKCNVLLYILRYLGLLGAGETFSGSRSCRISHIAPVGTMMLNTQRSSSLGTIHAADTDVLLVG